MKVDDPMETPTYQSIPVKKILTALEVHGRYGAQNQQCNVLAIWMYMHRFPEWMRSPKCNVETRKQMEEMCKRVKYIDTKEIWECINLTNIDQLCKDRCLVTRNISQFAGMMDVLHAIHQDLIKQGVLVLPNKGYALEKLLIIPDKKTYHYDQKDKKNLKRNREIDRTDPYLQAEARLRKRAKVTTEKKGDFAAYHKWPLWNNFLRKFHNKSLEEFCKGNVKESCLFIKDHHTASRRRYYTVKRSGHVVPVLKLLTFYLKLYPTSGYRMPEPNDLCKQYKSQKGSFLCCNPFHFCNYTPLHLRCRVPLNTTKKFKANEG